MASIFGRIYTILFKLPARAIRKELRSAINIADPIGGALRDVEILLAFAAQSSRKIQPKKIQVLTESAAKISAGRTQDYPISSTDIAAFWTAYDDFAADMAPLSAHSIRASMEVNCMRFPRSLFAPTAYNAGFAVIVFLFGLALQGFWVAGKELVDRADATEAQKSEVRQKMTKNGGLLKRTQAKILDLAQQRCNVDPNCEDSEDAKLLKPDLPRISALNVQMALARTELDERRTVDQELNDELEKFNQQSRPLESLLRQWHERARSVCSAPYLRFICPVDNIEKTDGQAEKELRRSINELRTEIDRSTLAKRQSSESEPGNPKTGVSRLLNLSSIFSNRAKENRLQAMENKLAILEADRFRSIVVEVRIIIANLGTYLIAMVMGILGALTFILRSLSSQLRAHTYIPVSASISIVRFCLGAIAGVFGSLLAPGDMTLKTLPPLFIPFVFGYGIEILFSLLDKVVKAFTQAENQASIPRS